MQVDRDVIDEWRTRRDTLMPFGRYGLESFAHMNTALYDGIAESVCRVIDVLNANGQKLHPSALSFFLCTVPGGVLPCVGLVELQIPLTVKDPFELDYLANLLKAKELGRDLSVAMQKMFGTCAGFSFRLNWGPNRDNFSIASQVAVTRDSALCDTGIALWTIFHEVIQAGFGFKVERGMESFESCITISTPPTASTLHWFNFVEGAIRQNNAKFVVCTGFCPESYITLNVSYPDELFGNFLATFDLNQHLR